MPLFSTFQLEILGYVAGALDAMGYIPQSIHCVTTGSAKDISLVFLILKILSSSLWMIYAWELLINPIIFKSIINLSCISVICYVKMTTEWIPFKKIDYVEIDDDILPTPMMVRKQRVQEIHEYVA